MNGAYTMEQLPQLPADIGVGSAAIWSATVLMQTAMARGWSRPDIIDLLTTLLVVSAARDCTDAELHELMQTKLDSVRAGRAVKS